MADLLRGGDFTATWGIHFRIADEILKHLHQIDREYFIIGNIAPDCGKRVENGYDPPTEVTHLTKMWNKSDCNCEFIFENCIKDEIEFKKKSFFAGYYTHLLTDRLYSRLISMPIEEEFGKYREHPGFSKLVKREWYDADFKFFAENKSPAFAGLLFLAFWYARTKSHLEKTANQATCPYIVVPVK